MSSGRAILVIVVLLAAYAVMARTASNATSATYDEPLHLVSAYVIRHNADFRMNPEDPPLFQRWLALALPASALSPDYSASEWSDVRTNLPAHWAWVNRTLYPHPSSLPPGVHVDHRQVLADTRGMMLMVALALGGLTAWLAWTIASDRASASDRRPLVAGVAGVFAAVLFAFDPSFLGHGPLVKNDIALSLSFAAVAVALVRLGGRITAGSVALLALSAAVGVSTKFSGLLLGPFIVGILLVRAFLPWDWQWGRKVLSLPGERIAAALGISLVCLLTGMLMLWAVYGFRYSYSPDPAARVDLVPEIMMTKTHVARAANPTTNPAPFVVDATAIPAPVRLAMWINDNRLLPETWAKGFIYTYGTTLLRATFLMGEISELGWWYYFPAVLAFKVPLGTMLFVGVAATIGAVVMLRRRRGTTPPMPWSGRWATLAPLMLAGGYFLVAVTGNMNLGIRHLLPMLPMVFAVCAAVVAAAVVQMSWAMRAVVVVALVGLAAESLASHHRYIAFFNLPARLYGPEKLLTDSNLDWGQDLPALAEWQARNPGTTLSLAYFGLATPESHGIRYKPLTGTPFSWERATPNPAPGPGVVAISATWLQEVYMTPSSRGIFSLFRHLKPIGTINGTIFLYNWPPTRNDIADEPMKLYWRTGDKVEEVPLRSALPRR